MHSTPNVGINIMKFMFEGRIKMLSRQMCISVVDTFKMDDTPNTLYISGGSYYLHCAATTRGNVLN